jgi:hypothetical protein
MLGEAYGKAAMKKTQVYMCNKCSRDGRASVNDDLHCLRPSTLTNNENIKHVCSVA